MEKRLCLAAGGRVCLTAFLILAGIQARGYAQTDLPIYTDSLQNGWANWSWDSTLNFSQTSPVHGGANSLAVTITSSWGALYLEHADLNSGAFASPSLWLNGGSSGG